ncbi:MAG: hypothetical protein HW421_1844 [Ignavibacteria bacterium]|nr:hypothetical protein [Ignavibacteria bacterium]
MKKNVFLFVFFLCLLTSLGIYGFQGGKSATGTQKQEKPNIIVKSRQVIKPDNKNQNKLHAKCTLNCKTCHYCEYPTKKNPCLIYCPRDGMVTVFHTPEECPEVITLDEMSVRFGAVVFSHKIHAEMSQMSNGCQGCHHYNTTGPVLACRKCHEQTRIRKDLNKVDLKGAYHRQCMTCHRQWSHTTDCNFCHISKVPNHKQKIQEKIIQISGKEHPKTVEPNKLVFETSYKKGKFVTFYHEDHIKVFNVACNKCHWDENCITCHDPNNKLTHGAKGKNISIKTKKTFDEHHAPCNNCHKQDHCNVCHNDKELEAWDHFKVTKFELKPHHDKLACTKCHERTSKFQKLNSDCNSCHKNFKPGKFNHNVVALKLSDNHADLACESCHVKSRFKDKPVCKECHDDKEFPKSLPGEKIAKKKK